MFCKKCGNELVDGAAFCIKCGWKVEIPKAAPQPQEVTEKKDITRQGGGSEQPVNKKLIVIVAVSVVALCVIGAVVGIVLKENRQESSLYIGEEPHSDVPVPDVPEPVEQVDYSQVVADLKNGSYADISDEDKTLLTVMTNCLVTTDATSGAGYYGEPKNWDDNRINDLLRLVIKNLYSFGVDIRYLGNIDNIYDVDFKKTALIKLLGDYMNFENASYDTWINSWGFTKVNDDTIHFTTGDGDAVVYCENPDFYTDGKYILVVGPCTYYDEGGAEEYFYNIYALYKIDNDSAFGYKLMYAETE